MRPINHCDYQAFFVSVVNVALKMEQKSRVSWFSVDFCTDPHAAKTSSAFLRVFKMSFKTFLAFNFMIKSFSKSLLLRILF